jgi:hyaluronate lyase
MKKINNSILEDEYDKLRYKWRNTILGVDENNLSDLDVNKNIENIAKKGESFWFDMDKSRSRRFLWKELADDRKSDVITESFQRLMQMALAYSIKSSALENNKELLRDIINGLDWMYENKYNENASYYDNWWPWDIGIPLLLNDMTVLLYDELTSEQINNYMKAINRFVSDPTVCRLEKIESTGANRVDLCKVVAVSGIISKDNRKLSIARDSLSVVFQYVTGDDGFYRDGSFVQHDDIPYTCSYGAVLIEGVSVMLYILADSPWQVTDPAVVNAYEWIYNSYEPLIYKGGAMDMVRGRAISRHFLQDHVIGHEIISSILRLATIAPEPHHSNLMSMVKQWLKEDWSKSFYVDMDVTSIYQGKALMKDERILPKEELIGHWNFANMDRVVHRGPGYAFAISMYSKRIQNYEDMNDENKKAWYTSDGMTYLYNNDLNHYSNDFWPTVNPHRIAGTTVDTMERQVVWKKDGMGGQRKSSKSWVGGTSIDKLYGTAGMELESGFSTLTARKSWFMFQKEIVALGAGITSTDNRTIETIIENRRLENSGDNTFIVDGNIMPSSIGCQQELDNVNWIYFYGNNKGSDIGYYFPYGSKVKALREERKGAWRDINVNGPATIVSRNYLSMWFDHGINPINEGYAFVILPNKTAEEVKCYAEKSEIIVLENTKEVQAVKNTRLNIVAANFWEDEEKTVEYISCNKKASIMVMEKDNTLEISISDTTMENEGTIDITINKPVKALLYKDESIVIEKLSDNVKFSVNVKGASGKSFGIRFAI